MKRLLLANTLLFSGLSIFSQNYIPSQYSNYQVNTQQTLASNMNINTNLTQVQTSHKSNNSAFNKISNNNHSNPTINNNIKPKNKVIVQSNTNPNNNPVANNIDNNINDISQAPNQNKVGGNMWVNENINTDNQKAKTKVVVQQYGSLEFKPIGLSGRDYSDGGKMKKGMKNFYTAIKTKRPMHKKKPKVFKVKHHTSKCATW